jgi:catechol 2,3-dioxygenase-like lactoylglutathione lyase family enzyme
VLEFDHVIIAVRDLDAAARRLEDRYGLASVAGGRHPGHGTGNRIIPLGPDYLELMAVVDPAEAAGSPLGSFVARFAEDGERPMALCLRSDDVTSLAARLGLEPVSMSRLRPDGVELAWTLAGVGDALGPERLPFFIEWHVDAEDHPGRETASHAAAVAGIAWVEFGADPATLASRLGDHDLDLRVHDGERGPSAIAVATASGVIVVDAV